MIPAPARYLLRLDDLCPTMHRARWQSFRALIDEFRLKPILAVIPDNRDSTLDLSPPDPIFWNQLRALEAAGAAIALHGFCHLCRSNGRSLLGLHQLSEFAGISADTQRAWIADGLNILRDHGLNPRIFVAPRHGFDINTLCALRAEGMTLLSDGFSRIPFLRGGVTWIPQQLWGPVNKPDGLWTICIHPNTAADEEIEHLRAFLRVNADLFISVDCLLAEFPPTTLNLNERIYSCVALWRVKASRARRRLLRVVRSSSSSK
jgi:predicted deacetylase